MKFFRTPALLPWLYPSLTWRIDTTEPYLYLTFDDGPVPGPTEFVLDLLAKESIKATFFCIGHNVERHPAIFERINSEGHMVGNHTYDHVDAWKVSTSRYTEEVGKCNEIIKAGDRAASLLFRPPYGRLTPSKIRSLNNFKIVMWDVLSYDFDKGITPDQSLKGTLNAIRPGSIVLFHDSFKASKTMTFALPRFIDECRSRGYSFRPLGESAQHTQLF